MWFELLRGALIAVTFFFLGALWVMGRWRRALRQRQRRPAPGTVVGVATEEVERGQLLTTDLRPYFSDPVGCMFCRGRGFEPERFLSHDDEHCPERR